MSVFITGANRGIGLALADSYRAARETVYATSRRAEEGLLQLDVTNPEAQKSVASQVTGPLDLLICNAGVYLEKGDTLDDGYASGLWAESFATNVTGVFLTVQALLPQLRAAKGKIAIISSQMGSDTRAPGGSYIYRASKAALDTLTKDLARRYARDKIAVNSVAPVMTEITLFNVLTKGVLDRAIAAMQHGHAMRPSEVAAWVGFLISPAGDISSGNAIILNQGRDVR